MAAGASKGVAARFRKRWPLPNGNAVAVRASMSRRVIGSSAMNDTTSRRRRLRFSLRTILLLVLIIALGVAQFTAIRNMRDSLQAFRDTRGERK